MVQRNSGLPDDFPEDMGKHSERFTGWLCVCAWCSWAKRTSQCHIEQGVINPAKSCQDISSQDISNSHKSLFIMTMTENNSEMNPQDGPFSVRMSGIDKTASDDVRRTGELQDTARQQLNVKICKDQMQYVTTRVTTCNNSKTMPIMTCRVSNTRRNSMFTWTKIVDAQFASIRIKYLPRTSKNILKSAST